MWGPQFKSPKTRRRRGAGEIPIAWLKAVEFRAPRRRPSADRLIGKIPRDGKGQRARRREKGREKEKTTGTRDSGDPRREIKWRTLLRKRGSARFRTGISLKPDPEEAPRDYDEAIKSEIRFSRLPRLSSLLPDWSLANLPIYLIGAPADPAPSPLR